MVAMHAKRKAPDVATMPTIQRLNHWAYRCRDAEETRHFYEDILGLPLACVIKADTVPSTGEYCPYVHIFFEMADGSYVAFFDLGDGEATVPDPQTPAWVNHLALQMASLADVEAARSASRIPASRCSASPITASSSRFTSSIPTASGSSSPRSRPRPRRCRKSASRRMPA